MERCSSSGVRWKCSLDPLNRDVLDWNQRNRTGLSDVSPTSFLVPNLGPDWTTGVGPSMMIPAGDGPTDSVKLSVGPALLGYYHRGPSRVGARSAISGLLPVILSVRRPIASLSSL